MTDNRNHTVTMDNRSNITMTGVLDVVSFDMDMIVAETEMGVIMLKGSNLHVSKLNLQNGDLEIDGEISSLVYEDNFAGNRKRSFFGGLFK